ncbi:MAG: peroxiredoxin [Bryobacterales bacterium]|nr:peroxiredoxin [Bryobacterales bacterium]
MLKWLFPDPLPVGSSAPDFSLPDQDGKTVSLQDLRGRNVVLVFYPGDDTTVCRRQLCEFRDRWADAQQKNTLVFGVNPQNAVSHAKFIGKSRLPFPLLVDQGQLMGALYRTKGLIVRRTVYLIGPDGVIRYVKRGTPGADLVLSHAV